MDVYTRTRCFFLSSSVIFSFLFHLYAPAPFHRRKEHRLRHTQVFLSERQAEHTSFYRQLDSSRKSISFFLGGGDRKQKEGRGLRAGRLECLSAVHPWNFFPRPVNSKSVCILKYPPAASARLRRGERPPPLFDERTSHRPSFLRVFKYRGMIHCDNGPMDWLL